MRQDNSSVWNEAKRHHSQLAALIPNIAMAKIWNRLNVFTETLPQSPGQVEGFILSDATSTGVINARLVTPSSNA